jgi:hypothetical protein
LAANETTEGFAIVDQENKTRRSGFFMAIDDELQRDENGLILVDYETGKPDGKINTIYRARRYFLNGYWRTWYEPCHVVGETAQFITIESETYPDSPLYPGGIFRLKRSQLEENRKAYHSRHGEWFWLNLQDDAFFFPSKDVLTTADFVMNEALVGMMWDLNIMEWAEWQRNCYLFSTLLRRPLRAIVDQWKSGGEREFRSMEAEYRSRERAKWAEWGLV